MLSDRCDTCGDLFQVVGYDEHHRTPLVRCACCAPMPTERCKLAWHWPVVYRYEVSCVVRRSLPRFDLNRYPGVVIGAALVVGRFAYCVKWGWAR